MSYTAEEIMAFGTILTTLILAVITLWYALETRRMRKVMAIDFQWKTQISLEFEPPNLYPNSDGSLILIQNLINIGTIPIILREAFLSWHFQTDDLSIHKTSSKELLPIYLLHDERRTLSFNILSEELPKNLSLSENNFYDNITAEIVYKYSDQHNRDVIKNIKLC